MPSAQQPHVAGIRSLEEWFWNCQYLLLRKFGQGCEEMLPKPSQSEVSVLYAFGTETTSGRKLELGRMNSECWISFLAEILDIDVKKSWQNLLKAWFECSMPSAQKPLLVGIRSSEEWHWKGQHAWFPKFWTTMWRNSDKTFSKRGFSTLYLRYRNHFWLETEVWKNGNGTVNICSCESLDNDVKKCYRNLLKARFQCSMPSAQKPRVAGVRNSEDWIWKGKHALLPKFWTTMWRSSVKTFSKRGFSIVSLRHRNHFWTDSEVCQNEFGRVNIYWLQNFGQRCEKMLAKTFQREVSVFFAIGTETTCGRN